ncbi:predicted protein [Arabidopsis lyrata subsp. lyrata]|uniref:Predicted protein n=1 Tax=Arabidopsis lyrata subsp. lyrata TaxID=81972 RepID=D7MR81_ARALL|nr:predicted protein [Arabidopsis lyrata subsp. lyrata]EFH42578.1 predicted protein [Arabidopsis lyrata subsp. lyrata]
MVSEYLKTLFIFFLLLPFMRYKSVATTACEGQGEMITKLIISRFHNADQRT